MHCGRNTAADNLPRDGVHLCKPRFASLIVKNIETTLSLLKNTHRPMMVPIANPALWLRLLSRAQNSTSDRGIKKRKRINKFLQGAAEERPQHIQQQPAPTTKLKADRAPKKNLVGRSLERVM
mmetsp:Transcript_40507/g.80017  ORF Transcript_40507/g.80017 Transcript_40507/m.80017 type:complete len:123 (-) Transcript_40507:149-517(-)